MICYTTSFLSFLSLWANLLHGIMFFMKIKEYLDKADMTYAFAARMIGVSRRCMGYIMTEGYIPSRKVALKIEEFTKGAVKAKDLLFPKEDN